MDATGAGAATAPLAAAVLATIASAKLPAGTYDVTVESAVSNTAVGDQANLKLQQGSTDILDPLLSGESAAPYKQTVHGVVLDGATALNVVVIANATTAIKYEATIIAVRTADRP